MVRSPNSLPRVFIKQIAVTMIESARSTILAKGKEQEAKVRIINLQADFSKIYRCAEKSDMTFSGMLCVNCAGDK
jgi:hypothetical protein